MALSAGKAGCLALLVKALLFKLRPGAAGATFDGPVWVQPASWATCRPVALAHWTEVVTLAEHYTFIVFR